MKMIEWILDAPHRFFIALTIGVVAVVGLSFSVVYLASSIECTAITGQMQRPNQFGLWTGCLVMTSKGEWVPLKAYRVIE